MKIRLFNPNERITDGALNAGQILSAEAAIELADVPAGLGYVVSGLHAESATNSAVSLSGGFAVLPFSASPGALEPTHVVVERAGGSVSLGSAPSSGTCRIDTIYLSLQATDDENNSVYVRDPTTGVTEPQTLATRRRYAGVAAVATGTAKTGTSFTGSTHTDVVQPGTVPSGAIPLFYVFRRGSTVEAVVDARPMAGPRSNHPHVVNDTRAADAHDYVRQPWRYQFYGSSTRPIITGSRPDRWTWVGADTGVGVTANVRVASKETDGIPLAPMRWVDALGISRVVPPGQQASTSGSLTGETQILSVEAALGSPTFGLYDKDLGLDPYTLVLAQIDYDGAGSIVVRNIGEGWSYGSRGRVSAHDEEVPRVLPRIEVQDHEDDPVTVRVRSILPNGADVPFRVAQRGVVWKVTTYGISTRALVTSGVTVTGTTNTQIGPWESTKASATGTLYLYQDTFDVAEPYFDLTVTGTAGDYLLEVEAVLPQQFHVDDTVYGSATDARNDGAAYYVPGGKGIAKVVLT